MPDDFRRFSAGVLPQRTFPSPRAHHVPARRTSSNCTGSARGIHTSTRSSRRLRFREASPSASIRAGFGRPALLFRTLSRRADSNPGENGQDPQRDRGVNDSWRPVPSDGMRPILLHRSKRSHSTGGFRRGRRLSVNGPASSHALWPLGPCPARRNGIAIPEVPFVLLPTTAGNSRRDKKRIHKNKA